MLATDVTEVAAMAILTFADPNRPSYVPIGLRVGTPDGVEFITVRDGLAGNHDVMAVCTRPGARGNVGAGTITAILPGTEDDPQPPHLPTLRVTNRQAAIGGVDAPL
jgi:hypothetical protein